MPPNKQKGEKTRREAEHERGTARALAYLVQTLTNEVSEHKRERVGQPRWLPVSQSV
jgi:hypothetical protein